jgi:hypothetical protein
MLPGLPLSSLPSPSHNDESEIQQDRDRRICRGADFRPTQVMNVTQRYLQKMYALLRSRANCALFSARVDRYHSPLTPDSRPPEHQQSHRTEHGRDG